MSNPSTAKTSGLLERFFHLNENGTSVRQEFFGGLTSFMACCYLIFVIPTMLADAGMDRTAVTGAVVLTTIVVTLIMGLWANYPVVVAPGLGITAFFAYYVCGPAGFTWQAGLGAVLISGVVFFLLTVTRIRQWIVDSVPKDLKYAIVVGIGTFIAFIGFKNCGIVVSNESTSVALGDLTDPKVLLALFGFFLTAILNVLGIRASMIIGILATTALGVVTGHASLPEGSWFSAGLPDISKTFFQLDLTGALSHGLFTIIFTLTMVDLFDNMGVLIGVARKAGLMKDDGSIRNLDRAFISDSIGTMLSSVFGTTTATSYLESAAGAVAGARTGLSSVFAAGFFVLALFFVPLIAIVPGYATAPILILVGAFMMQECVHIRFDRLEIAIPAFLTIVGMPLTYNIATGFGFGFVSYTIIAVLTGRAREVHPVMYIVSIAFAINFALR